MIRIKRFTLEIARNYQGYQLLVLGNWVPGRVPFFAATSAAILFLMVHCSFIPSKREREREQTGD